jgi:DNA repair protein RadC
MSKLNFMELNEPSVKLAQSGPGALSDLETISLILSGVDPADKAGRLLNACEYDFAELSRYSYADLLNYGLSHLQAVRLIAMIEFSKRKGMQETKQREVIKCSRDVFDIFSPLLSDLDHEQFYALFLNRGSRVLKYERISQGGMAGTVTDVKIILRKALENKASGMILCHNHPSHNNNPSEADLSITKKIKEAAALMDIQVMDHIIIAGKDFYSFADNGHI